MPAKTLVVIMTDGMENASKDYKLKDVQKKIKEQSEKYSWEFIYQGVDITTSKAADELGIRTSTYGSREKLYNNYKMINSAVKAYRSMANTGATAEAASLAFCTTLNEEAKANTEDFEKILGRKISTT
jgi:hypothetical protein